MISTIDTKQTTPITNTEHTSTKSYDNVFDILVEQTNSLFNNGTICDLEAGARNFIINRVRFYTDKIANEDLTIYPYYKFINYMPSICRKFFTALTVNNLSGRLQDIKKKCTNNFSLWSWSSNKKDEEGKRIFVYIVTSEKYFADDLESNWTLKKLNEICLEIESVYLLLNKCENEDEKTSLHEKLTSLQKEKIDCINTHIGSIINNMHFFTSRSDAKEYIIERTERFIVFQNPSLAKARRRQRSEGISDYQEL